MRHDHDNDLNLSDFPPAISGRRHDLDFLRGSAMLIGIALHASLSFVDVPWPVQDVERAPILGLFVAAVHGFRMPLFFMLSGFFTAMLWQRRGNVGLLKHRALRIALPFALGCITIVPLMWSIVWMTGMDMQPLISRTSLQSTMTELAAHQADESGFDTVSEQAVDATGLLSEVFEWLMWFPLFHHLWFLWYLCWLVAIFALVSCTKLRFKVPAFLLRMPWCLVWLVPLTMLPQAFMHFGGNVPGFGPDLSAGMLPMPHVFAYYAIFFFFGTMVYLSPIATERMGRGWLLWLMLAMIVLPLALVMSLRLPVEVDWLKRLEAHWSGRWLANLGQVMFVWLMIFGLLGLVEKVFSKERRAVRYVSDSSYWLYLVHLPLIVVGQWWMQDWPLAAFVKFALLLVGTCVVLLVSYHFGVRYTWVGTLLNGKREKGSR